MARISRRTLLGLFVGGSMLALAGAVATPNASHAAYEDAFLLECTGVTPSTNNAFYPGADNIILSNNLARPVGKAEDAAGQIVYLTGRVVDQNCVPVEGAIIDLWQADPFGKYRTASREELLSPNAAFAGNGRAVTDNMGRYQFVTLFPGANASTAPKMHLRVRHPDLQDVYTTAFFRGDQRNNKDGQFRAYRSESQALLLADVMYRNPNMPSAGLEATFNITLQGVNPHRRY